MRVKQTAKWSDVDFLVVLPDGTDKRQAAVLILRTLGDLPVAKDIVVSTPEEIDRRGHVVGKRAIFCAPGGERPSLRRNGSPSCSEKVHLLHG